VNVYLQNRRSDGERNDMTLDLLLLPVSPRSPCPPV